MLLEVKPLPRAVLEGWEAEFVDTTALGDSFASCAPTGHVETRRVTDLDLEVSSSPEPDAQLRSD